MSASFHNFLTAGVESALYSLLLSLAICIASVAVFTVHPLLLLPILLSILGKTHRLSSSPPRQSIRVYTDQLVWKITAFNRSFEDQTCNHVSLIKAEKGSTPSRNDPKNQVHSSSVMHRIMQMQITTLCCHGEEKSISECASC